MAKDLKYFMRKQEDEIVTAPAPPSFKDEKGNPVNLEIKVLGNAEIQRINDSYRTRAMATDRKGNPLISMGEIVWKTDRDSAKASRHILVEALVYPNLKDKELMSYYKCTDVTDMPMLVFSKADEYAHVSRAVMMALGLGDFAEDEDLQEAKN